MNNRATNILAALLLAIMLTLSFAEMFGDSQTMDEVSHLPAGYSYISQQDMRINPEHPPLIKDLSGASVWLWSKISNENINFPYGTKAWEEDINGQWDFGFKFMYGSDNNADKMLFFGRLPMLLILLLLGFYIFRWARELFGNKAALLALFLFSFSPTFIAHGHLVTTDVAATAAIFISLYYFVRWLKSPGKKNLIIAGIILGLALLTKFSTFLLIPLFGFMAIIWIILKRNQGWMPALYHYLGGLILICVIAAFVIYPIYLFHVWNYPVSHQVNDINFILNPSQNGHYDTAFAACAKLSPVSCATQTTAWMASKPILRPWAQYAFGFLMVFQRATGGNTTYFLGEVSNNGWKDYFPIVYALKEPLAMHTLTILALLTALFCFAKTKLSRFSFRLANWLENHIAEFGMLCFIILYWVTSLSSNLNIGVRHLLPTFPFVYVLISGQASKWLKQRPLARETENNTEPREKKINKIGVAIILVLATWQAISVILVYPNFLSYFNELAGGPANGYKYVVDSNLDWGQDVKRLARWADENNAKTLYMDYFGGTDPAYYLGNKFRQWHSNYGPKQMEPGSYLAVSATFLQNDLGQRVGDIAKEPAKFYSWLNQYQPVIIIGNSIFVYHIP